MFARRAWSGLAFTLGLGACGPQAQQQAAAPPAVDSAAVRSAASAFWQKWAAADTAGDATAIAAMVGDSARLDVRGLPPMIGRAAFAAAIGPMLKSMKVVSEAITAEATTAISNELAYETGNYTEETLTGGKAATDYGRYAGALRRYADGEWRLAYLMAFSDSTVPKK